MSGETELDRLLENLQPELLPDRYVFCSVPTLSADKLEALHPLAWFREAEGISLVLEESVARGNGLDYTSVFSCITLTVHSSLDAVGLTAAVSRQLAEAGIAANIIAATFHDHVFVPADAAEQAIKLLNILNNS